LSVHWGLFGVYGRCGYEEVGEDTGKTVEASLPCPCQKVQFLLHDCNCRK
jgi:hypothetical protein